MALISLVLVGSYLPALRADSPGQYVRDPELIAKATEPSDWIGQVEQLPLK
jgi:hypothetical protein